MIKVIKSNYYSFRNINENLKDRMEITSGKLVRAVRKFQGLNQIDFSQVLGISQPSLSRIEADQIELSAYTWFHICEMYDVDPRSLISEKINALRPIEINPMSSDSYGNFKLHKRYKRFMGSTVRTAHPFIEILIHSVGKEEANNVIRDLGVDPDYFVIQNLPISIKFIEDLFLFLSKRRVITETNLTKMFKITPLEDVHDLTLNMLQEIKDPEKKFKKLMRIISSNYEKNSKYKFEGDKKCYIKARDNKFIPDLKLSDEFQSFRKIYNLAHMNGLASIFNSDLKFSANQQEGGWDIAQLIA